MESFKLKMPVCPQCGGEKAVIDIRDYSNLVRIPAAVATGAVIGIPITDIVYVCEQCEYRFRDMG